MDIPTTISASKDSQWRLLMLYVVREDTVAFCRLEELNLTTLEFIMQSRIEYILATAKNFLYATVHIQFKHVKMESYQKFGVKIQVSYNDISSVSINHLYIFLNVEY